MKSLARFTVYQKGVDEQRTFPSLVCKPFPEICPFHSSINFTVDGHSSHYSPAFIKLAAEEGIIIFVLPPNTTHITQPLDKGCFSPLKVAWRQACHDYRTRFPGRVVTRLDFNQVFSEAWYLAMTPHNIVASFKTHALKLPNTEEKEFTSFHPESIIARSGLKYIPLYSPSRHSRPSETFETSSPRTPVQTALHPKPLARFYSDMPLSERFNRASSVPLRTSTTLLFLLARSLQRRKNHVDIASLVRKACENAKKRRRRKKKRKGSN